MSDATTRSETRRGLYLGLAAAAAAGPDAEAVDFEALGEPAEGRWSTAGCRDDFYDLVFADHVLGAAPRPTVALAQWLQTVRPGGVVLIDVGGADEGADETHWRFAVQDPIEAGRTLNLLPLLQSVCHLATIEEVGIRAPGAPDGSSAPAIRARLRRRPAPLTPEQSNDSGPVRMLADITEAAVAARSAALPMAEFEEILGLGVRAATVVDLSRLYLLYQWLLTTEGLPGAVVEVGSFRGGTGKLLSETLLRHSPETPLWMFDTFEGMPSQLAADEVGLRGTFTDTSLEAVQRLLGNNPAARLVPGIFPHTVPAELDGQRFRLAHIDVDIETSVHDCLEFLYPRMVSGGVLVIDDYGHAECPGATRATEAFFAERAEYVVQMPLLSSAVVVKR